MTPAISGGTLVTLGLLVAGALVVLFAAEVLWHRDGAKAAEQTIRRSKGVTAGAASAAGAAAVVGTQVLAQLPEILIALVGLGSIVAGISWEMAGATMVATYIIAEAINGGPAGA